MKGPWVRGIWFWLGFWLLGGCDSAVGPSGEVAEAEVDGAAPSDTELADAPDTAPDAGTPGRDGTEPPDGGAADTTPEPPALVLNELNCAGRAWIEVANAGTRTANAAGFILTDGGGEARHRYVVPAGVAIAPGGLFVVSRQDEDEDGLTFGIDCDGETIDLIAPNGARVDRAEFVAMRRTTTWGRLPDARGPWQATRATPGEPNEAYVDDSASLFEDGQVVEFELGLSPEARAALDIQPYNYVVGTLRIAAPAELETSVLTVGVRLKGKYGSFQTLAGKAAFRIDIDRYVAGQTLHGLETLVLNNFMQDGSFVHEATAYRLFAALGVPAPRTAYAWVRVDGEDYGLYLNLEEYDDRWLDTQFGGYRHLFEGEYGIDITSADLALDEGDETELDDLTAFVAAVNGPDEGWLEAISTVADWPEMLRMMAVEQFIGHWDGYAPAVNNYFIASDAAGLFHLLAWGTDQTFSDQRSFHDGYGLLFARCRGIPACFDGYVAAVAEVADVVEATPLDMRVAYWAALIRPYVQADPRKPAGEGDFDAGVQGLREFLDIRVQQAREFVASVTLDGDGDGVAGWRDCDDGNPDVHPGAVDVCSDGIDQDCDGYLDNGEGCPDCIERAEGGRRYLFCTTPRNHADSVAHCGAMGAAMARIESVQEAALVDALFGDIGVWDVWAGVNDEAEEGVWRYADGDVAAYLPWSGGEPNNCCGGENCAEMWGALQWNDTTCDVLHRVICEQPCTEAPRDGDGDGYASTATCGTDCDDTDPTVHPEAVDVCEDGIDQDCSGKADDRPDCPAPCFEAFRGARRYVFCPNAAHFPGAVADCARRGLELLVIDSAAEARWWGDTASMLGVDARSFWINATDDVTEGDFRTTSGMPLPFVDWAHGEPSDPGGYEDCALAGGYMNGWADVFCGEWHTYGCEAPCPAPQDGDGDGADGCGRDCDDGDPAVFPGAAEVCGDGLDQDCSGVPDDSGCLPTPFECRAMESAEGRGYVVCQQWVRRYEAQLQCLARGMTLAVPDDAAEVELLLAMASDTGLSDRLWVGITDEATEGVFLTDAGGPAAYLPWAPDEPNDPGSFEDCLTLSASGLLDSACSEMAPFLCEPL